ncbi:hypothetical protein R5R61_00015 [Oenococcus oeni]|uniref:L.oenos plasmid p4028 ORF1, ORF2, ORF3, ORF4, ORF5 genes n=2 Tax=Oenococcus oeni TaxID=1247 RepID=Q48799_OENOE|nr:hypothetical protein [Oenococcus oeni]AAB50432.1 unknown [Oenococcus oeni]OIL17879.1 hypothetical protein ATW99_09765 [Oenococcus oeni]OIL21361.1 hypothetical protein ATX01_10915 [Oenococcus oeni]OIL46253.1 hypothetical protein ATX17_09450 [Oenococcus oeni]OIL49526.1 hypothetical protein ATX18_10190 [Oenococcus oeni]
MAKTLEERLKDIKLTSEQIQGVKKAIRADKVAKRAEARRKVKQELINKLSFEELQAIVNKNVNDFNNKAKKALKK